MDVSIIIVNFNTKELTRNCLASIFEKTEGIDFEVIVSDNGSSDGSAEMIRAEFPQVILIENDTNLGFGAANNRGLKIAKGKYVFYLNSDTMLLNNAVKIFFDYWEKALNKNKIGALGAYLLDKNGNTTHSYGVYPTVRNMTYTLFRFFISSLLGKFKQKNEKKSLIYTVDDKEIFGYVTGADLFLKNAGEQFFDERFFMYFEETDLQYNFVKKRNLVTYVLKEPLIVHFEGASDKSYKRKYKAYDFRKKSSIYYWISCLKYFRKNSSIPWSVLLLKILVFLVWIFPLNIGTTKSFMWELMKI